MESTTSRRPFAGRLLQVSGALAVGSILWYALAPSPDQPVAAPLPNYAAIRQQKDAAWRTGPESPLPDSLKARFPGLHYFAPDTAFVRRAFFEPLPNATPLLLPLHNAAAPEPWLRVGRLTFRLAGRLLTLTALRRLTDPATAPLFVPFTDATTGHQTYGGGRYLNVAPAAAGQTTVWLDFNQSYAPTCAHVADFICPLPPPENQLPVAVAAGERQ